MIYFITKAEWERIPEEYKEEHSIPYGYKDCFLCFLTRASQYHRETLCFEHRHFEIKDPEERRTFSEVERRNGGHAVHCLQSEKAKRLYDSGALEVWEYRGNTREPLERWNLYAYLWRGEYAEDLTQKELETRLIELSDFTEAEKYRESTTGS